MPNSPHSVPISAKLLVALGALAGCTVHEIDRDPAALRTMPGAYPASLQPAGHTVARTPLTATPPRDGGAGVAPAWWGEFDDAELSRLITDALGSNLTAAEFAGRLAAARAFARQEGATRLPAVDGLGSAGVLSAEEDGVIDAIDRVDFVGDVGVAVGWEIDLFGRLRSREEAAVLDALAAAEDLAAVRLAVAADTAEAYYAAVEQVLLLELLRSQIERDRTLLELIELRFAQGDATGLDLLRQRAQLADAEALVPPARADLRRAENTLDALLGEPADGVDRVRADFPSLPLVPAAGVPSQLLVRRPDLLASQRRLVATDARIAEAIADRLPRLTLTGSLSYAESLSGSGFAASLLGGLTTPLFDAGRREAVVDERRAEYEALLSAYAGLFVDAVAEVDGLLYSEQRQREQVAVLADRVDLLDRAVVEARNRYVNGIGDYTDVLLALDDLQETQRDLLATRATLVQQRIAVYRAVGGSLGPDATPEHYAAATPPDEPTP